MVSSKDFPLLAEEELRLALMLVDGLTCSEHSLTGGGHDRSFLNLDDVLSSPTNSRSLVSLLVSAIRKTQAGGVKIDKLGYIDVATRGPLGLLSCRTEIASEINLPSVVVRPDKRLHTSQVSGKLDRGDNVAFLCDVLTIGHYLAQAYTICARHRANIASCFFVYDRLLGGRENLAFLGTPITALMDRKRLLELAKPRLTKTQQEALGAPSDSELIDLVPYVAIHV
jgi:orotate phosphoribosyltransferase